MKIVVSYSEGDGCTYSCDVVKCVEADSEEEVLVKIDEGVDRYLEWQSGNQPYEMSSPKYRILQQEREWIDVGGVKFPAAQFVHAHKHGRGYQWTKILPTVQELTVWFAEKSRDDLLN